MEGRSRGGAAAGRTPQLRREQQQRLREIRRRRLRALGIVAAVATVCGAALGAGSGGEDAEPVAAAPAPQCLGSDAVALRRIAGQRLVVRTDGTPDNALLDRAKAGEIAGVIVFPSEGAKDEQIRKGISRLQAAARAGGEPPLVVATDQEGGPVKRFLEAPPLRAPSELAQFGDAPDAKLEGAAVGNFLKGLGINTDLAPVLDVPASDDAAIAFRAFGDDARRVTDLGLAFADGLAEEKVLATAKHFPGLGRSTLNTDFSPSEIPASRRELAEDLRPFEAAIKQGVPLVMVGVAAYPQVGSGEPAALDPKIATGLLRDQLGFAGVSISDDLQAAAISSSYDADEATVRAADAGIDLLLFARTQAPDALGVLAKALSRGELDLEVAREACVRVVELREGLR